MKLNSLKLFVFHFILILNRNAQFYCKKKNNEDFNTRHVNVQPINEYLNKLTLVKS